MARLKIALTGAHGTGKSTLCNEAAASLRHKFTVQTTPEVPRLFIEDFNEPLMFQRHNNTFERQALIVARQIEIEASLAADTDILICDRTIADHWAYTEVLFPSDLATLEKRAWRGVVRRWVRSYDLIVRLPIEFDIDLDGVREADKIFQNEIDETILALYREFEIEVPTIRGDLNRRLSTLTSLIESRIK